MENTKVYADSFSANFADQNSLLSFLAKRDQMAAWETRHAKDLRVVALDEGVTLQTDPPPGYTLDDMKGIIEDTMENTRLLLKAKDAVYPVRTCAVKSLLDRAKISGTALGKVEKPVLARILNHCLRVANGDALLRIADGKVSAVHGGDRTDYAVLDMPELFKRTVEYLYANFPGCTFAGGFYEHAMVTAVWELTGDESLVKSYQDALDSHGIPYEEMKPALRLTSSDTGVSGANLYPTLFTGKRGGTISLGSPLKLEHKSGATLKDFDSKLALIYSQYKLALGHLEKLLDIEVNNPENCMLGVCKKIGISKKQAYEATELFLAQHGTNPCTAHDIYYGISEVIFMMQCDGAEGTKIAQAEETVARALSVRWHDFDMPGQFKW